MRRKGVAMFHQRKLQTQLRSDSTSQNEKKRLMKANQLKGEIINGLTISQQIQRLALENSQTARNYDQNGDATQRFNSIDPILSNTESLSAITGRDQKISRAKTPHLSYRK